MHVACIKAHHWWAIRTLSRTHKLSNVDFRLGIGSQKHLCQYYYYTMLINEIGFCWRSVWWHFVTMVRMIGSPSPSVTKNLLWSRGALLLYNNFYNLMMRFHRSDRRLLCKFHISHCLVVIFLYRLYIAKSICARLRKYDIKPSLIIKSPLITFGYIHWTAVDIWFINDKDPSTRVGRSCDHVMAGTMTNLKISAQLGLSSTWIPDHMHNNCLLPIEIFPIEGILSFLKVILCQQQ